jgi:predicted AAA+ superfamily ATPase
VSGYSLRFKYGQVVSGADFCPRPEMQKQLASYIQSGQNVVVYGERRIGKTSLIYETLASTGKRRMLQIDLMDVKSLFRRLEHSPHEVVPEGDFTAKT